MSCDDIRAALSEFDVCEETTEGSRFTTHCLYPSFEPVFVYVAKIGDGFKVHDGRGAFNSAWLHGRDEAAINRALTAECKRFRLKIAGDALVADVPSADWLVSGILSVANASAAAANVAVAKFAAATERNLADRIAEALSRSFAPATVHKEVELVGRSGGKRHFDFAINPGSERAILINAVAPHHGSVSSKYVAFADTEGHSSHKFAVYDQKLDADDVSLLQQVARIVPIEVLTNSPERVLG
jgi:hypothetical protein